jgi:hypothetical protein
MLDRILLLLCLLTLAAGVATTTMSMDTLHSMLDQASAADQRLISVNGYHLSTKYLKRLVRLEKIHQNNVHDLEFSFLEKEEVGQLRSQTEWKNPLAGVGHKGSAIPYFNGYACVTGILPGPSGKCFRDKGVGKALLGCSGKPNNELLEAEQVYASEHCACSMCGGGKANQLSAMIGSGLSKKIIWTPYCHTRGINNCICGLVDMSIKDEATCYDLW